MKRLIFITIPVVALVLLIIHLQQRLQQAEAEHDRLERLANGIRKEANAASSRMESAKADNTLLVQALTSANAEGTRDSLAARPSYTTVKQRLAEARALIQKGDLPGAAEALFWLYDIGIPQSGSFIGLKNTWVLDELGKIAKNYPPARQGLAERCEAAQKTMLDDPSDTAAPIEFTKLSKALDRQDEIFSWYAELQPTDQRRRRIAAAAFDEFVEAGKYSDAVMGKPYSDQVNIIDAMITHRPTQGASLDDQQKNSAWIANFGDTAGKYAEALAGSGDVAGAKEILTKLLAIDSSTEAKEKIQARLTRAGHPELLDEIHR